MSHLPQPEGESATSAPPVAYVERDLEDLIPGFLENRQEDLIKLRTALNEREFARVAAIAHTMKGSGGGYGFEGITEIGEQMEKVAKASDAVGVETALAALTVYLERVQIVYT